MPGLSKPPFGGEGPPLPYRIKPSRPPAHKLAFCRGEPVIDQLPRFLINVAFRAWPVVGDASPHLLRELVCRPAPKREQPKDHVGRGRQSPHLTRTPNGSI